MPDITPTDTEILDWLESRKSPHTYWVCRDSSTGRGMRVHEVTYDDNYTPTEHLFPTIRAAVIDAMERYGK